MSDVETAPVWKKLYHTISGGHTTVTGDVVEEILNVCKGKLVNGLLQYTPYKKESFQSWKENPGLKDFIEDNEMSNFIHHLSKELNLDVNVAWTVTCNFLMFEYFGKVDELKSIIRYDTNVRCFIDNIWYFYTGDRMFLIKTLRHIFENVSDKEHIFYEQFDGFFKSIDTNLLWNNLVKTFDNLINEIDIDKVQMISSDTINRWVHRNNREQIEVVILLTHAIQFCQLNGQELENILVLFLRHSFARHPLYSESNIISRPKDILEIKCAEIGCVLAVMERYWQHPGTCKMLPEKVEKNMELLQLQGDNSIVLFSWAVLKTSVVLSDEAMDYCNIVTSELIKKKVFKSLHTLLTNTIFANCKSGDIVVEGVFRLMSEFIKICADYAYLHEQEGVCYVTAELLRRKGLVVLDYLGPIFQLSLDAFPFVFNPFLEVCKSLISIPDHYDTIMKLLKNIPGFLAEIPWNDHRERFTLVGTQKLFIDSDLFIIPEGTIVERFRYQGMEFARFIHPFSFFLLMEQFIKSFNVITFEIGRSWYCYDNLTELVQIGFRFIVHILKHYKGDFRRDTVLRKLVQRLEIVPTQFCEGPMKNFNFIRLYFETNVTLITYNLLEFSEVFPPIIRRKFMPQVPAYSRVTKHRLFISQVYNESILFKCLKEEENSNDHSLLIEYLKLIEYMVEKNLCHEEVQAAGIWYLLYVAFPLHQQWPYQNDLQMTIVCKYCISIFVKVLQRYRVVEGDDSYEIFKMCCNAFLTEEVVLASYLSVLYKDKFYLQNLMEEESNWIGGTVLEYLENIRLQMVLLLLVYKLRSSMPETPKCALDDKIDIITKAVSAFMVNPYSTSLRILSFRLLEVLAGDENVPLMALLGLDYDQIQRLFLDKLRDPMEDDNVKMHILELISNCIFYQHGMTAAFFNVKRSRRWYTDNKEKTIEGDTVTDFMIDYLQNIKKSHEYLRSPLQLAILRVMTNLWLSRKQHLIRDIISLDAFWPLLVDPLFKEFNQAPTVYAYILEILSIQLVDPGAKDKKFLTTVEKFLTDEKQLTLWQQYIFKILKDGAHSLVDIDKNELLIKSWMEFVLSTEREHSIKKFCDEKVKYLFIEMCLDGFQYSLANMYCLETWVNLCLIHVSSWGLHFEGKDEMLAKKVIHVYSTIKLRYGELNHTSRASVLTIAQRVLKDLQTYFKNNSLDLQDFLEQIGPLINYEYKILDELWEVLRDRGTGARELFIPWTLSVSIINILLKFENINDCAVWFSFQNILQKLVKCICDLLSNSDMAPMAKLAIRSLTLYVQSPLALDFINVNMTKFYDSIEPPITSLLTGHGNKLHPLNLAEGWVTSTLLMKFNLAFLKRFQFTALPSCYVFLTLHEKIIQHVIHIPESTVSLKALDLLLDTLRFFDGILSNWHMEWYRKSTNTYNFVLVGTKKIINSCLYTILRPKNIVMYRLDEYYRLVQVEKIPIALMVGIMNRLITAAGLGFSVLYKMNPSLVDLLDVHIPDTRTILILNDFSVPKFELPVPYDLTYGKLLCLAHFMCKTLDALNFGESSEVLGRMSEKEYSSCVCFVEHQGPSDNLPHQKLSAFLRYAMYEYSGLADPWIQKLDYHKVKKALELLMFFLAQQVYLYVKTTDNEEGLPYYKRNLASELQFFYEYVKRHTSILLNQQISVSLSLRSISSYKAEMDIMKKYLLYCQEHNKVNEVIEKNFCLVISHWFTSICHIR